jgi:outer membrane receptor protein involved in Fe transport
VSAQNRIASIPEGTDGGPWGYIPSDPHTVFNFSLGLNSNTLPGYPKLRFIVKNIFDNDYQPFGSYIPAMGRNIKVLLSFHF